MGGGNVNPIPIALTPFLRWVSPYATNTVVRSFFGKAKLCSFCSPVFQKIFVFHFSPRNREINDAKVVFLLELIVIIINDYN